MHLESLDQFENHFKTIGYKIEHLEPLREGAIPGFEAIYMEDDVEKGRVLCSYLERGVYLFMFNYTYNKKHSPEMDSYVNKTNASLYILSSFVEPAPDDKTYLTQRAIYFGAYEMHVFNKFLLEIAIDHDRFREFENYREIFR